MIDSLHNLLSVRCVPQALRNKDYQDKGYLAIPKWVGQPLGSW